MGWGDGWTALANQSFGLAGNIVQGKLQEKSEQKRLEAAEKALAAREEARRLYEEQVRQKSVVKTYEDPDGNVSQITQGQIERGEGRVPQSIVEQRKQEREAAEQERLRKMSREDKEDARADKNLSLNEQRVGISQAHLGLARNNQSMQAERDAMGGAGAPAGPTANRIDENTESLFQTVMEAAGTDTEAKNAAAMIYQSGLSPEEKVQRLRALRARLALEPVGGTIR